MKVVTSVVEVELPYNSRELIGGRWIPMFLVSKKLRYRGLSAEHDGVALRSKLYNGLAGGKYNVNSIAGVKCIDVVDTMKARASLCLKFREEGL